MLVGLQLDANLQQYEFKHEGAALPLSGERMARGMRWQVQQAGMQHWWRERCGNYPQEFRDHMDSLIRDGEAAK